MTYEEYSEIYDAEEPQLKKVCQTLELSLKNVLSDFLDKELFRIRITEARVKEKDSLHAKLVEDDVSPEEAFTTPGKVRDLIGARIVCHNLDDIDRIIQTIEDSNDSFTIKRARGGKEKKWIEQSQEDFGYRGHHIDVLFLHDNVRYQAELQVRTLLQDAWATFMHHDVYKGPIHKIVKQQLSGLPKSVSDLFLALDKMSQSLRDYVERNPISPDVKIKTIDAIQHKMNSFVEFFSVNETLPIYKTVKRTDRYFIDGQMVRFKHSIDAEVIDRAPFEIIIGGDSGSANLEKLSLTNLGKTPHQKVPFETQSLSDAVVKVWRKPKRPSKHHHYQVECEWPKIFEQKIDYIFSPWARYYGGAEVDYVLEIQSKDKFFAPPKCFLLNSEQPIELHNLFSKFGSDTEEKEEMEYFPDSNTYRKEFLGLRHLVLCLIHFE